MKTLINFGLAWWISKTNVTDAEMREFRLFVMAIIVLELVDISLLLRKKVN